MASSKIARLERLPEIDKRISKQRKRGTMAQGFPLLKKAPWERQRVALTNGEARKYGEGDQKTQRGIRVGVLTK